MSAKAVLKKTREAIDAKDYPEALKLSKSCLKDDQNNYVALVYAGLSSQELGAKTEAEEFYEKAIQCSPTNILAWQGLGNFYDKCIEASEADAGLISKLLKVYCKIIDLDSDDAKVSKILNKIERPELAKLAFNEVLACLNDLLLKENVSDQVKQKIQRILLTLLCDKKDIPEDYQVLYKNCYLHINHALLTVSDHLSYFKFLYSTLNFTDLLAKLTDLNNDNKSDSIIFDWFCYIFIELHILQNDYCKELLETMPDFGDLVQQNISNKHAQLAQVILKTLNETNADLLEIKDSLEKITKDNSTFLYGWIVLYDVYLKLQFYEEAISASSVAEKLLKTSQKQEICLKVDQMIISSHSKSNNENQLRKAIEFGEKKLNENKDPKVIYCLIEAHLTHNNISAAKELLDTIEKSNYYYILSKTNILKHDEKYQEAMELLEKNPQEGCEYWVALGDLYWDNQSTFNKALTAYLKATKANPSSYICYQRLGRFYQKIADLEKSKRCYEKSLKIKSTKTVCVELSKIYRKLQKWDENLALLISLTSGNITPENSWAYFQLGIHYYERENFAKSMNILRFVIRIEPDNCFCWESLADCYFSAGSYTSALKCYQIAKTIDTESLYPLLQIANIKKIIGEFAEARDEFIIVLKIDDKYVPALKGVAETCFLMAKQFFHQQLYGLTRDALQSSLNYVSKALHGNATLSCCWKIAADCCYTASLLPFKYAFLSVSDVISDFKQDVEDDVMISEELLKIAIMLYCKALSFNQNPNNVYIYHDLASSYVQYSKLITDKSEKVAFLNHALSIIQYCINNNASCARHWNVLGNIFLQLGHKNELAQHAFIKAVSLDHNNAVSWTNLGTLYLSLNELKLANEVFSQAQKSNPNYVSCWIGQALIAEASGMEEAMDLFRHTMELSYHPEGTIGYASWVCKTLMAKRTDETIYAIDNMFAIPVACDGLRWYVENNPADACAWNMLGVLSERLGLISDAMEAYKKAIKYSKKFKAYTNYGRTLTSSKLYADAIACYETIPESDRNVNTNIAYALTLFKHEDYENAYKIYESVLEGKLENQIQSDLLMALASMIYMFEGPESAKHLLFQSTQLKTRSPWSLYAVLSLGLLDEDLNLAKLAFAEIVKQELNEDNLEHYSRLLMYTFLIQGKSETAVSKLSALIFKYPVSPSLWLHLSTLLYRTRSKPNSVIAKCAQASLKLKGNNQNLSMVLPMVTATSILSGDLRNALKAAERLVHYFPNDRNANETLQFTLTRLITCSK